MDRIYDTPELRKLYDKIIKGRTGSNVYKFTKFETMPKSGKRENFLMIEYVSVEEYYFHREKTKPMQASYLGLSDNEIDFFKQPIIELGDYMEFKRTSKLLKLHENMLKNIIMEIGNASEELDLYLRLN